MGPRTPRRWLAAVLVLVLLIFAPRSGLGQQPITYIYDALGRLVGVVDPASNQAAFYSYDAVGNLLSISRQSASVVSIVEFAPASGPVGTVVTIYGTGFSATASQNTVSFNGATATVTSATPTQLVTAVPAGATSGPISVTAPGGSATSTSAFTVGTPGAPAITGFAPTIGTTGTAVTITGTNFDPTPANDKVRFNLGLAAVTSATPTAVTATMPAATGSGHIAIATPGGNAVSADDFFVPPSPYVVADVQATGRMGTGGDSKTVTISTASKIALIVFDGTLGQRLTLQMTGVSIASSTSVKVYSPTLSYVTGTSVTTSGGALNVVLGATGTHTILIAPSGTNTGSMTLTFSTPDLAPTAFTAPSAATTQQAISLSWTVANQGTGATQASWSDYIYLSTNAVCCSGATLVTAPTNPTALAAGASYTQTKTVTVPNVPAGNYNLFLKVDYINGVYEASETNNERVLPITITTPDLTPTAFTAPSGATTQQAISLSWTVNNQGTGGTQAAWFDYIYLSTSSVCCSGATLVTAPTNPTALAAGASYTQTKTVTVPNVPAGNYNLFLKVDYINGVYEASETNNERVLPITITTPDLTPTAFTAPSAATTQQTISVSWTVNNQGTGPTQAAWFDYVYLSADQVCCSGDTLLTAPTNPTALGSGASYTQTKNVTLPNIAAGNYYLILRVDHLNGLYEANETNNQSTIPITITP